MPIIYEALLSAVRNIPMSKTWTSVLYKLVREEKPFNTVSSTRKELLGENRGRLGS